MGRALGLVTLGFPLRRGKSAGGGSPSFPLLTNLCSFWELEEASGTRDDAHSTNDLTDFNTVTQTTGKVGNAAVFVRANSERLQVASNATLQINDASFYLCGWVHLTTVGVFQILAAKNASGGNREWSLSVFADNRPRFMLSPDGTAETYFAHGSSLSVNTWYFLEAWHDAAAQRMHLAINRSEASQAWTTGVHAGTAAFALGSDSGGGNHTDGYLDQFGFWKNGIPTSDERDWLYNSGSGRSYAEIAAYTG